MSAGMIRLITMAVTINNTRASGVSTFQFKLHHLVDAEARQTSAQPDDGEVNKTRL